MNELKELEDAVFRLNCMVPELIRRHGPQAVLDAQHRAMVRAIAAQGGSPELRMATLAAYNAAVRDGGAAMLDTFKKLQP